MTEGRSPQSSLAALWLKAGAAIVVATAIAYMNLFPAVGPGVGERLVALIVVEVAVLYVSYLVVAHRTRNN